jgi:hypothetical protein
MFLCNIIPFGILGKISGTNYTSGFFLIKNYTRTNGKSCIQNYNLKYALMDFSFKSRDVL